MLRVIAFLVVGFSLCSCSQKEEVDILITDAIIYNGITLKSNKADIAIKKGEIVVLAKTVAENLEKDIYLGFKNRCHIYQLM